MIYIIVLQVIKFGEDRLNVPFWRYLAKTIKGAILPSLNMANPIRPGLLSRSPGGGEGGGLRGPDATKQDYLPLIEMKFGMSHYGRKSMPDATYESGNSSGFGNMTPLNFSLKKGTSC